MEKKMKYQKLFDIQNMVTVVTGATGLIGSALCEGLAEFNAVPVITDLDGVKCEAMAADLQQRYGVDAVGIGIDVSSRDGVERLKDAVLKRYSRVDALVYCAQNKTANFFETFENYSDADWNKIMNVNLKGVFLCCQIFGRVMLNQKKGNIINFASTYGVVSPDPRLYIGTNLECPVAYSSSKGGVIMLTKQLAAYWSQYNIRINAITPHGVYNDHQEQFVTNFSERSPMRRMSEKEEVVGAMIFLLSDAASYITGHNLMVDGGWSII